MALTQDTPRVYTWTDESFIDVPVKGSTTIYEGSALGEDANGYARPLVDNDAFRGFAMRAVDNSAGADGDLDVHVRTKGEVKLSVANVTGVTDINATVYATDDNTFSTTDSGTDTTVGRISRWISGTTCMVRFETTSHRSL